MPTSYKAGKKEVRQHLLSKFPQGGTILDVGPGEGAYWRLLHDKFTMHCCEIHQPYIDQFELRELYDHCVCCDIRDWHSFDSYNCVIMGDVLEHLTVVDAQRVLDEMQYVEEIIVAVPFEMTQGAVKGVESERHHQADLTPELFAQRYTGFKPLFMKERKRFNPLKGPYSYGYYIRS